MTDEEIMKKAIELAKISGDEGEVPVGAVVTKNGEIVATGRNILLTMIEKFDGGPVGLDTLAAAVGEDPGTIEDVYEPYFIMNGFINRTPRGRVVTELCYRHLGLDAFIK